MKICLATFALLASAVAVALSADKPIDLTGADASTFRSQVGHTVVLRGRLEDGKEGLALSGATRDVTFYVVPEMPPSGVYSYPKTWTRFMHNQVRLTGELKFRPSGRKPAPTDRAVQVAPEYFYMVMQHAKIERVELQ